MPSFSTKSREALSTCHLKLQIILEEAIKHYDFSVLCGFRDKDAQNEAYASGASKLEWPRSRHNTYPSRAVDVAPYPIAWDNKAEFYYLAGLLNGIAAKMGVRIVWGGRWTGFVDLPHIELHHDE